MGIDLKSCPFCGGKASLFANNGIRVLCQKCGASTRVLMDTMDVLGVVGNSTEEVIKAWNRRTEQRD